MAFDALELSIDLITDLADVEAAVRLRRKKLADEIARCADSIALNLGEGRHRIGRDRGHHYRIAAGSAGELTTALRIACGRKLITWARYAAVDAKLDRIRAMLWRLTR